MESIIIVSGLPRSGTSMMMKALKSGGVPILTDNIRKKDQDNPQGYYEFEPVKKTKQDSSWLKKAQGKAVKMVYRLLYDLPPDYYYQVIFMQRNIKEVLASQKEMLKRKEKEPEAEEEMEYLFKKELKKFQNWINKQNNFKLINVNYAAVIKDPVKEFKKVKKFLEPGKKINVLKMAQIVDPDLYRIRKK
jgi:hypothetical protein